jgi:hypothetical protein
MLDETWAIVITVFATIAGLALISYLWTQFGKSDFNSFGRGVDATVIFTFLTNILPFSLLGYGFAADIIDQQFRRSLPSILAVGVSAIVGLVTQLYAGNQRVNLSVQETTGRVWCTIPGLESLESPYIPTSFIATGTIMSYYLYWMSRNGRTDNWKMATTFAVILFFQITTFFAGDCQQSYIGPAVNFLVSLGIGAVTGGIAYGIAQVNPIMFNPFDVPGAASGNLCEPGQTRVVNGCQESFSNREHMTSGKVLHCDAGFVEANGQCVKNDLSLGGHSKPVEEEENVFVAELYKNGQLVTDSISS